MNNGYGAKAAEGQQLILPYIPESITVHLGPPDSDARNVTVPFTDYIKNVASSEIYPTWPENALRANIIAQTTFALNRIYTEYYPSRGYDFDITNSTAIDQSFIYGRDIFENINDLVDELFDTYIRREGSVEPIFSLYCNGTTVTCDGMSQWGSVSLANEGRTPFEILKYYYGDDIELVRNAPVAGVSRSYPGRILERGSSGNDVRFMQVRLNRISKNYPAIPKIRELDGIYADDTADAVSEFQRIFSLPVTGAIDKSTWYAILRIYGGVKSLSDLDSEGIPLEDVTQLLDTVLSLGSRGVGVRELQYFLRFVSVFDPAVYSVEIDGIFGGDTEQSVRSFQREYGLPETGIVDTATWEKLYRTYQSLLQSLGDEYFSATTAPYPGFAVRIGSTGAEVERLQEYLNRISDVYTQIPKLTVDGIFGPATRSAVIEYQKLFGLYPTGIVGFNTYNSLTETYRAIVEGSQASQGQYVAQPQ